MALVLSFKFLAWRDERHSYVSTLLTLFFLGLTRSFLSELADTWMVKAL